MPYRPFEDQNCSIARAVAIVGERWTLLVLREVLLGRGTFREIRRQTGIAANILSDRLQTLVEHDVLDHLDDGRYVPTQKGRDVWPVLAALMTWGDAYESPDGPPRVHVHTACGHDAHPAMHCAHCGEELQPGQLQVRPGPGASGRQREDGLLPARG